MEKTRNDKKTPLREVWLGSNAREAKTADDLNQGTDTPNRLGVVLSTAVDGIIIMDEAGRIQSFNPACERLFGYSAEETLGNNVNMLMPTPYREEHDGYLANYYRTGQRKIIGIGREVTGQRKDGSTFPMELSVGETIHDGARIFVGIIRDISERKAAETNLRESEERIRAVIDTAVDGVIIIDASARIQIFNPACQRLFGYSADEVIGENVKMLMPPPYHGEHDGYMANYRATGERKIIGIGREVMGQRKDGSTFPMELSVGEAFQDGKPVFVGIVRDITERKDAELAIKRSVDELAAFAYSVAHDMKAPLRAIEGFSMALVEDYGDTLAPEAGEYLDHIADSATRMGQMIDDLLDYSRIGRDDLLFKQVPLQAFIGEILTTLDHEITSREAEVTMAGEWDVIEAHTPTLNSVFQNLIMNALKFTRPDAAPRVRITGRKRPGMLEIAVADNGIGIPENCFQKVFQIFHRLHDRKSYPGTGIGLAIVKKGIDVHQGTIELVSEVGKGTTVTVFLPLRRGDRRDPA